ncbi:MAG: RDD family protein [Acidobacteria bacterium]|nr:RDD family protein [Acidobacteriota bacterium]
MTCQCGEENSLYDHRCERCGRPLESVRPDPRNMPPVRGSLARVPAPKKQPAVPAGQGDLFQGTLFPREPMRVVQMPQVSKHREIASRTNTVSARSAQERQQQRIQFPSPVEYKQSDTIYTNAPVALPVHRMMAGALDTSMLLIGLGIFLAIFQLADAQIVLNKTTMPVYGVMLFLSVVLYRLMWCLAGTDSVGTRWAGLRVITFDGVEPDRRQRLGRMLATYISWMAGGLGLVWALADEEKLTWHDHMSKTFPTPRDRVLTYYGR